MASWGAGKGRAGRWVLVLLVAGAVIVECVEAGGWSAWNGMMGRVEARPQQVCRELLSTRLVSMPAVTD